MDSNFYKALNLIREKSENTFEQGFAFEKLCKVYFENDDIQKQEYEKIWHYKDWAKDNPTFSKTDIGIDLVGKLRDGSGLAAIQCKFFNSNYQISKEDLDSFVSAASNEIFKRLVLIDTSNEDLGSNAKSMINNLNKTYQRIQKYDLENSRIDWVEYIENKKISLSKKRDPRDHQLKAIAEAKKYYSSNDRGKMIMACGTGKTYASLKIAEEIANKKFVLYMVPSLALMSQSIREWKNDSVDDFLAFSACSDKKVGKIKNDSDQIQVKLNELAIPATTNSKKLAEEINKVEKGKMTVVFSTYQSIEVISDAQKKYSMKPFDLIICDEAHRTTGATFEGDQDSYFVRIHDDKYVEGKKRLYMTATPRIFGNKAKQKADAGRVELASMDDPEKFGKEFFNRGFNWAVENNLLSDYKVVILAIDESLVSTNLQKTLEEGSELKLTDATKIIGVYKALAKVGFDKKENEKLKPVKRALAFSQGIEISKIFEKEFSNIINEFIKNENIKEENKVDLNVEVKHIDGSFNADQRNDNLNWLKSDTDDKTCRILSNVKCLSEGVDVPTLDAIMFLHPKKSQIDVVQAVGRVMRKAEGKNLGYVIIPVTVAPGVAPEKALNDNENYKVVWQIVNALRTHDERLDSKVNLLGLGEDVSDKIEIVRMSAEQDATTAKVEDVAKKRSKKTKEEDEIININQDEVDDKPTKEEQMSFELDDLSQAIKAKIVEKCGTRDYWENWADDIGKIAQKHIDNFNKILVEKNSKKRKSFEKFLTEIRDDLNPEISEGDAIEMMAQHIITKPVFNSLFQGNEFSKDNNVSKAIEKIISEIYDKKFYDINKTLDNFYKSVERRTKDIITSKGRTTLINELYERFFSNAFPKTSKKLGIVYTPIEIVDFMINSVEFLLNNSFNKSLNDKKIEIIDPFTGTGTFITRLLQSKIIDSSNIQNKFKYEIHANEIVLLAYYIAGINIETVYQDIVKSNQYTQFPGLVLTDTFQLFEQDRDMIADLLPDNSKKRTSQRQREIKIILGNPPYSAGQKKEDDDTKNLKYFNLDQRISKQYASESKAQNVRKLYDSYIRAFSWATERIKNEGIIAFITGSGWLDKHFSQGLRKNFTNEFNEIYVINLRGDRRKDMLSKSNEEGDNVFGHGSMSGITITFLVKKQNKLKKDCNINYLDIGKNHTRREKLKKLEKITHIGNYIKKKSFNKIIQDENNDWINQGNKLFQKFYSFGSKKIKQKDQYLFETFSLGVGTNRDMWCYNFSKKKLRENIKKTIFYFNECVDKGNKYNLEKNFKNISWTHNLKNLFKKNTKLEFKEENIRTAIYRPFIKTYLYFDKNLNERRYQIAKLFPANSTNNKVITVNGIGSRNGFSTLMVDKIPDLNMLEAGTQSFPLNYFDNHENKNLEGLFSDIENVNGIISKENISNEIISNIRNSINQKDLSKEEFFYYIYGILLSEEYKRKFENDLLRELPRIPIVKSRNNFKEFSIIGKKLSDLHINFENQKKYKIEINNTADENVKKDKNKNYFLTKMKFVRKGSVIDKSKIIFNKYITLKNIPLESYKYVVNGKSPIEWIMDKHSNQIDEKSGISNNTNDYSDETMKNPAYSLELLQRIITVSLETQKLIKELPKLDID